MQYTHEHLEIQKTLKRFIDAEINPHVDEWEAAEIFPAHEVFKKLGNLGLLGLTQPVMDQTIQADRTGNFTVAVAPTGLPIPGARYDIRVTSTSGTQTAEERLTLHRRG